MKKLQEVEYRDGLVLAFTDGEVSELMHMGANRMGREWKTHTYKQVGSLVKNLITEPTHVFNEKHECIVFNNADEYSEWFYKRGKEYAVEVLYDLQLYDAMRFVRDGDIPTQEN